MGLKEIITGPPGNPSQMKYIGQTVWDYACYMDDWAREMDGIFADLEHKWTGKAAAAFVDLWTAPDAHGNAAKDIFTTVIPSKVREVTQKLADYAAELNKKQEEHLLQVAEMAGLLIVDAVQGGADVATDGATVSLAMSMGRAAVTSLVMDGVNQVALDQLNGTSFDVKEFIEAGASGALAGGAGFGLDKLAGRFGISELTGVGLASDMGSQIVGADVVYSTEAIFKGDFNLSDLGQTTLASGGAAALGHGASRPRAAEDDMNAGLQTLSETMNIGAGHDETVSRINSVRADKHDFVNDFSPTDPHAPLTVTIDGVTISGEAQGANAAAHDVIDIKADEGVAAADRQRDSDIANSAAAIDKGREKRADDLADRFGDAASDFLAHKGADAEVPATTEPSPAPATPDPSIFLPDESDAPARRGPR